jgi:hypothetical protein
MLTKISDVPDSVLGFRASGELTSDDYQNVLVPAVEAALRTRGKLRLLYLPGEDVTGFTPGAAWQDTKVGMAQYGTAETRDQCQWPGVVAGGKGVSLLSSSA